MDANLRIVTELPLQELWREDGFTSSRGRSLSPNDITTLLRLGPVQFVVVGEGSPPYWVPLQDCERFWNEEDPESYLGPAPNANSDGCPDGSCFLASEWGKDGGVPVVVFEVYR